LIFFEGSCSSQEFLADFSGIWGALQGRAEGSVFDPSLVLLCPSVPGLPACNRCTSTGRHCDGYPELQTRKKRGKKSESAVLPTSLSSVELQRASIVPMLSKRKVQTSLPPFPDCSPKESRLLHVFFQRSIDIMTPWHGGTFWPDHVPRRGHFESATRHAMIALVGGKLAKIFKIFWWS
jgi:hypothetical protein